MTMAFRRSPRRAREHRAEITTPRLIPTRLVTKRSRWRKRRAITAERLARKGWALPKREREGGGVPRAARLTVTGQFSGERAMTVAIGAGSTRQSVPAAKLDRWAAIQAGVMPADEDVPRPPSEDEVHEREREALAPIETAHRRRDDQIIEANPAADLRNQAALARANDEERRAAMLDEQADEADWRTHQALEASADEFQEEVETARRAIWDEVAAVAEEHAERLKALQADLQADIENTVNATYFASAGTFNVDEFNID